MKVKTFAAGATIGLALVTPSVASADHVSETRGDTCIIGAFSSGVEIDLYTTDFRVKEFKDGTLEYTCRFDVPEYVPSNYDGEEQYRPKRYTASIWCWYGEYYGQGAREGSGEYRILPNGTGVLRCRFPAGSGSG